MNVLIVVGKLPAPGQTKTRLVPPLSFEEAAALSEGFLRDTLDLMRAVSNVQRAVAYLPHDARDYFAHLAPDFDLLPQTGNDLGARLDAALTNYLVRGAERAVIMNSDGPTLPIEYLRQAFEVLIDPTDVVLGPSADGGYYLIGLRKPARRLLREVRMSTAHVLADTQLIAHEADLRVHLLPPWYDVDDLLSLERLIAEVQTSAVAVAPHTRSVLENMGRLPDDG